MWLSSMGCASRREIDRLAGVMSEIGRCPMPQARVSPYGSPMRIIDMAGMRMNTRVVERHLRTTGPCKRGRWHLIRRRARMLIKPMSLVRIIDLGRVRLNARAVGRYLRTTGPYNRRCWRRIRSWTRMLIKSVSHLHLHGYLGFIDLRPREPKAGRYNHLYQNVAWDRGWVSSGVVHRSGIGYHWPRSVSLKRCHYPEEPFHQSECGWTHSLIIIVGKVTGSRGWALWHVHVSFVRGKTVVETANNSYACSV